MVGRAALTVAVLLLLAAPVDAGPRPPKWLIWSVCGYAGTLAISEIALTERCIQRGTCREVHPLMPKSDAARSTFWRSAIKGATATVVVRSAYEFRESHPWLTIATCAGYGAWNTHLTLRAMRAGRGR